MNIRVFVVDDLHDMQALLRDLFDSDSGFEVVGEASSEAEARLWLEDHVGGWDLAVIDLILASGSGFGVIHRAHELHPQGHIAILSGYASSGVTEHCLKLGASAVFDKAQTEPFILWLDRLRATTR